MFVSLCNTDPAQYQKALQSELLLYTTIGSILSLIPATSFVASLATRSVALVTLTTRENIDYMKVVAVSLGIVGFAAGSTAVVIASLIIDLIAHLELSSPHSLSTAYIDFTVIICMLSGISRLMAVASIVSTIVMLLIALQNQSGTFDTLCYCALAMVGVATTVIIAERCKLIATKAHFDIKNRTDNVMALYGKGNRVVAELNPGETMEVIVPVEDCGKSKLFGGPNDGWFGDSLIRSNLNSRIGIEADRYTYDPASLQNAMKPVEIPILTGTVIPCLESALSRPNPTNAGPTRA